MTVPTWPQITAAAASLRRVGGPYFAVADALEHDHRILNATRYTEPKEETK
jgi:hypothetical protein